MNTVSFLNPTTLSIEGGPLNEFNTIQSLILMGDNLVYDAALDTFTGTVTDFEFSLIFDYDALSEVLTPEESALLIDGVFYSGEDISFDFTEPADIEMLVISFLISYSDAASDSANDNFPQVLELGTSNINRTFNLRDDIIQYYGEDVVLRTGAGDDLVRGMPGAGDVRALMGNGDDTVFGGVGNDYITGGAGEDVLNGGVGNDKIIGNADNDIIRGGGGRDTLFGSAGDDVIFGISGDDRLIGGTGRDVLIVGQGNVGRDVLLGQAGADAFVFVTGGSGVQSGLTIIRDFNTAEDMLWTGPSLNGTWTAAQAFTLFMDNARQFGNGVLYREDDYRVLINNVDIGDLTQEHFVDGPSGGYYAWADLG